MEKRRGRPTKAPTPGERVSLGLRVTADLKERLDRAASENGRSQSQEAEYRLERSFADDTLFSSAEVRFWAILLAGEFHKAGAAAAGYADIDPSDRSWMKDPSCMTQASFAAMEAILRDLVRMPGSNPDDIALWMESLKGSLINSLVASGRARFVDKDGNDVVGFIKKDNDNAG